MIEPHIKVVFSVPDQARNILQESLHEILSIIPHSFDTLGLSWSMDPFYGYFFLPLAFADSLKGLFCFYPRLFSFRDPSKHCNSDRSSLFHDPVKLIFSTHIFCIGLGLPFVFEVIFYNCFTGCAWIFGIICLGDRLVWLFQCIIVNFPTIVFYVGGESVHDSSGKFHEIHSQWSLLFVLVFGSNHAYFFTPFPPISYFPLFYGSRNPFIAPVHIYHGSFYSPLCLSNFVSVTFFFPPFLTFISDGVPPRVCSFSFLLRGLCALGTALSPFSLLCNINFPYPISLVFHLKPEPWAFKSQRCAADSLYSY